MIFRILEDQYAEKSKVSKAADQRFMQLALTLGRRGQGRTWPNPAVGAVVVKDGVPRRWRALAMLRVAPRSM
jgi:diaminohydroxyphosphoribosylaminopyrimidine deaminase/5-amino-6-(5-phosphoribosylamino)uracil reductase